MDVPTTELLLRVNGIQAAFGIEFGFDSERANEGRAADPYRQANVSYSLVQRREGRVLIDGELGAQGMVVVEGTQRMRNGIDVVYDERRESDSLAGNGAGTFAGSD